MLIASIVSSTLSSCSILNVSQAIDCEGEIVGKPDIVNVQQSFDRNWSKVKDYNAPEDCQCTSGDLVLNKIKPDHKYMVVISGENGTHAKYYIDPTTITGLGSNKLKTTWNTNGLSDRCKMSNISVFSSPPEAIGGGEDLAVIPPIPATTLGSSSSPYWLAGIPVVGALPFIFGGDGDDGGSGGNPPGDTPPRETPPGDKPPKEKPPEEVPEPSSVGGLILGAIVMGKFFMDRRKYRDS